MQQHSAFIFFQVPAQLIARAKPGFLPVFAGILLVLCSVSKGHTQAVDTVRGKAPVYESARVPIDSLLKVRPDPAVRAVANDTVPANTADTSAVKPDSALQKVLKHRFLELPGTKEHTPKGATIRSLILPGWGQAYNHEYWKVPLAVAAVGIPIYLYIDNSREYNASRLAYSVVFEEMPVSSGGKGKLDAAKFAKLEQKFQDAYNQYKEVGGNYVTNFLSTLQSYRNTFRQYRDYSVVAALLGWGLQIADATVFGHLHGFNVSDDISMKVHPVYFQYARIPGIGLNFSFK